MDKRVIRFDGWKVDFNSGEISKDGATHRLQDQPLQILDELLKQPGEVVTREQLIARLWPNGVVEFDTGLNSAMRKLRIRAWATTPESPRYIETLPRKGYRFIGRIDDDTPAEGRAPGFRPSTIPTPFETGDGHRPPGFGPARARETPGLGSRQPAGRGGPGLHCLAHARQVSRGGGAAARGPAHHRGAAAGGHERGPDRAGAVRRPHRRVVQLAGAHSHARVVARTSAFAFKGKDKDVREIAAALGATHVLEGSLRRSSDQLRITVQLIDASNRACTSGRTPTTCRWATSSRSKTSSRAPWPRNCTWS